MAKFEMFRATDKRDGKREIFVIRNGVDVAVAPGSSQPGYVKRLVIIGAVYFAPLSYVGRHIGEDRELIDQWEIAE